MFYELMMRKKEQIMYATIKGTLTENDGVFSGFSGSNYLLTQDKIIPKKDLTISVSLTTNNISSQCFFSSGVANHRYLACTIEGGRFLGYGYSVSGTGWEGGYKTTTYELESNTKYNIVFEITKNYVKVKIKKASETTFTEFTNTVSDYIHDVGSPLTLAKDFNSTKYFDGSIDLNNSYIKLGSTKYNLQAVVGYTIVGSPTIVDGVVSGFSGSDYLNITQSVSLGNNFEVVTKVRTGADVTSQKVFVSGKTGQYFNLSIQNGKVQQNIGNGSYWVISNATKTVGKTNIQANTEYLFKFTIDGNIYKTFISTDNGANWILDWSYTSTLIIPSCQIVYGVSRALGASWTDSINLNETYIKVNNKLVFNGQQA